jgi:hypothetical protein
MLKRRSVFGLFAKKDRDLTSNPLLATMSLSVSRMRA